jgi:transcriptional regulator with XRE-family HTH domain
MEPLRRMPSKQALAARLLLGWTQRRAAEKVSITISSVCEAEHGDKSDVIAARLLAVYEAAGIEFTAGDIGVGMTKAPRLRGG